MTKYDIEHDPSGAKVSGRIAQEPAQVWMAQEVEGKRESKREDKRETKQEVGQVGRENRKHGFFTHSLMHSLTEVPMQTHWKKDAY